MTDDPRRFRLNYLVDKDHDHGLTAEERKEFHALREEFFPT